MSNRIPRNAKIRFSLNIDPPGDGLDDSMKEKFWKRVSPQLESALKAEIVEPVAGAADDQEGCICCDWVQNPITGEWEYVCEPC